MPIRRQLEQAKFAPPEIATMTEAFDPTLRQLGLSDRTDPITELLAAKVIQVFRLGERDPKTISDRTIRELGARPISES